MFFPLENAPSSISFTVFGMTIFLAFEPFLMKPEEIAVTLLPLSEAGIITVSSVPKYPTADDVDLSIRLNSKSPMRIARW